MRGGSKMKNMLYSIKSDQVQDAYLMMLIYVTTP